MFCDFDFFFPKKNLGNRFEMLNDCSCSNKPINIMALSEFN